MSISGVRGKALIAGAMLSVLLATAIVLWATYPASAQEEEREPRIVGGTAVPDGKYPFMVSIQSDQVKTTPSGHFCGGTLLDRDSILTAAHCADVIGRRNTDSTLGFEDIQIVVGRTVLTSGQGQTRGIERLSDVKINPRFDRRTFEYDAAVIDLDRPVSGIRPVTLPKTTQNGLETPGRRLTITGWGNTIAQDPSDQLLGTGEVNIPNRMREARVPVVSDTRARAAYATFGGTYNPALMVAAGEEGKDSCQGDSGGPLFQRTDGRTLQVGITSFGFGCANGAYPGVYAEVNAPQIRAFIVRAGL